MSAAASNVASAGVVAAVVFGLVLLNSRRAQAVVLGASERAFGRLRSLAARAPRPPVLSGWFLLAASAVTVVVTAASAYCAVSGALAAAVPTGAAAVLTAGWCGLSAREVRAGWSDRDLAVIRARADLEERLGALPRARRERRLL